MKNLKNAIGVALLVGALPAHAQGVLPQGVGIVKYGQRYLLSPTRTFDKNGNNVSLGDLYSQNFSGPEMLKGTYGDDLKELATWINKYDSGARGGLLDKLTLGNLSLDVKAKLQIQFVGLGIGISDWLTSYCGAPYIQAKVDANMSFSGQNTAQQIKAELGDLVPDELQNGLDRASKVSVDDIIDSFRTKGYSTNLNWEKRSWGDAKVGFFLDPLAQQGITDSNHQLTLNLELSIPTGYLGKPDVLVDTDLGRGYYQIYGEISDRHQLSDRFFLSYLSATALGIPAKRELRVPTFDSLFASSDRLSNVTVKPGMDFDFRIGTGLAFSAFEPVANMRWEGHTKDTFSGSLAGDYEKLSEGSNYGLLSSEFALNMSTVNAYKAKLFPVPFLAKLAWKHPWRGHNKMVEDYIEFTLTAFFPTPFMEEKAPLPTPQPKQETSTETPSEPSPENPPETAPQMSPEPQPGQPQEEPIPLPPVFED